MWVRVALVRRSRYGHHFLTNDAPGGDRRSVWGSRLLTALGCGSVLAVAGAAELWLDCLDSTHTDFFAACAQVGPILGLAVFVELVVVMGPYVKAEAGGTKGSHL
jgi:hypothetical protein